MPNFSIVSFTLLGSEFKSNPKYSKISALPDIPDIERFPCLATFPPAPAITNDAVVEMLNVFSLSPPVPHTSIILPLQFGDICRAIFFHFV